MPRSHDTTPDADNLQLALYRKMTPEQRARLGHDMSIDARTIASDGIRQRHPDYDGATVRWALFRILLGDELFRRVWPGAPLVAP